MKPLLLINLLLLFTPLFSQNITVKVVNGPSQTDVFALKGEKVQVIKKVTNTQDVFTFSLKDESYGFYGLQLSDELRINFIYDGSDVVLNVDVTNNGSVDIIASNANKMYTDFVQLNKEYKTKSDLLFLVLDNYPSNTDYYKTTLLTLLQLQKQYTTFVESTSSHTESNFIGNYIQSAQLPVYNPAVQNDPRLLFYKKEALQHVDFSNESLIHSDVFTAKSIEYLSYYRNQRLPKAQLEEEFKKAVDTLLMKARRNDVVYQHVTSYLMDGFTTFGFETVVEYIIANYVVKDDLCLNSATNQLIEDRIQQAKHFSIGSAVPNIVLPTLSDEFVNLDAISARQTLILFFASDCPHCTTLIPDIYALYLSKKRDDFDVFAVSLDTQKENWKSFVHNLQLNWHNVSDLKGWSSPVATQFYIYATPTMFIVDQSGTITNKPKNILELTNALK